MSAGRKKRPDADDELEALARVAREGESSALVDALNVALASRSFRVVAQAAKVVKTRQLEGVEDALRSAWACFLAEPPKADPGCLAKLALLEALDFLESLGAQPFLEGARLVQLEAAWGKPEDSATGCRARSVLALARLGHPELPVLGATLLLDQSPQVRVAAADALGGCGQPAVAGTLLLKLGVGDEDPLVRLACMSGVMALEPRVALEQFAPLLSGPDDEARELAALCLGQSNRSDAAAVLVEAAEQCVRSTTRAVLLKGLGLHRSDAALERLARYVEQGSEADGLAAIRALTPRRFEAAVRARLEAAVGPRTTLRAALRQAFAA